MAPLVLFLLSTNVLFLFLLVKSHTQVKKLVEKNVMLFHTLRDSVVGQLPYATLKELLTEIFQRKNCRCMILLPSEEKETHSIEVLYTGMCKNAARNVLKKSFHLLGSDSDNHWS